MAYVRSMQEPLHAAELLTGIACLTIQVFLATVIGSEQTAAAEGSIGTLRRDPFAMLPFCGYNMGDYFQHWLDFRRQMGFNSPKIYYVNWFVKNPANGKFLWPGFGENSRVLKWICERVDGVADATRTPIGYVPTYRSLDLSGLDLNSTTISTLLHVDRERWIHELNDIRSYVIELPRTNR
jgi:phosphoenolpyruvate carboxykinase (GTP)